MSSIKRVSGVSQCYGLDLTKASAALSPNSPRVQKMNGFSSVAQEAKTFVQALFEGVLTNETRCLTCETVSVTINLIIKRLRCEDIFS